MNWRERIVIRLAELVRRLVWRLAPWASAEEPCRAIEFALAIDDHWDMREFLHAWSEGDTSERPEFAAGARVPSDYEAGRG